VKVRDPPLPLGSWLADGGEPEAARAPTLPAAAPRSPRFEPTAAPAAAPALMPRKFPTWLWLGRLNDEGD
jgi:hypothetical protein